MDIFLITLISLWINPVLGFILARVTKNKSRPRRYITLIFAAIFIIQIISILFDITFTSITVDFIFTSIFYLGICFTIWVIVFHNKKILKVVGIILAVVIFSINYLSGTVGILGVGFVLYDWETNQEIKLEDNLIYKEVSLGMALDDFRGKRVEIFRQVGFLPIERKITEKSYYNEIPWSIKKLNVEYNSQTKEVYLLGVDTLKNNEIEYWKDTLNIK
jgi:hypothetical protein